MDELKLALEDRTETALQLHTMILDELEASGQSTERFIVDADFDAQENPIALERDPASLGARTRIFERPGGRLVRTTKLPFGYDADLDELVREIEWLRERTGQMSSDT